MQTNNKSSRVNFFFKLILTINWIEVIAVWLLVLGFILILFAVSSGIPLNASQTKSSPNWIIIIIYSILSGLVAWFFTWFGLTLIRGIKNVEHWVFKLLVIKNILLLPLMAVITLWFVENILDTNINYTIALAIAVFIDFFVLFLLLYGYNLVYKDKHPDLGPLSKVTKE